MQESSAFTSVGAVRVLWVCLPGNQFGEAVNKCPKFTVKQKHKIGATEREAKRLWVGGRHLQMLQGLGGLPQRDDPELNLGWCSAGITADRERLGRATQARGKA